MGKKEIANKIVGAMSLERSDREKIRKTVMNGEANRSG